MRQRLYTTAVASMMGVGASIIQPVTPAKAFIKFDWECTEKRSDADCLHAGGLKGIFIYDEIIPNDLRQMMVIDKEYLTDKPFPLLPVLYPARIFVSSSLLAATMNQKSSTPQDQRFVSQCLMGNNQLEMLTSRKLSYLG